MPSITIVRNDGSEEHPPELERVFLTPLAQPGKWAVRGIWKDNEGAIHEENVIVPGEARTVYVMNDFAETKRILGEKPRGKARRANSTNSSRAK